MSDGFDINYADGYEESGTDVGFEPSPLPTSRYPLEIEAITMKEFLGQFKTPAFRFRVRVLEGPYEGRKASLIRFIGPSPVRYEGDPPQQVRKTHDEIEKSKKTLQSLHRGLLATCGVPTDMGPGSDLFDIFRVEELVGKRFIGFLMEDKKRESNDLKKVLSYDDEINNWRVVWEPKQVRLYNKQNQARQAPAGAASI